MSNSSTTPHSANLRAHRWMQGPGTFFVTKCVEPRGKVIDDVVAAEVCSAFCFYSEEACIYLGPFVVMLDHWHAVLATRDGKTISERMKILDQWLSRHTKETLVNNWLRLTLQENRRSESGSHTASRTGRAWQQGFHETRIRSSRQFQFVCGYIEENPIRAGLVDASSEWPWSSASPRYHKFLSRPWPWRFEQD